MEKPNHTRTVCLNCLKSVLTPKQKSDPESTRLVITWSCDKCSEEDDEVQFYDYQMRELQVNDDN